MEKHQKSNHHSASFSYLASTEENFVLTLTKTVYHQKKKNMEDELSVFDAEKYYNMKLKDEKPEENLEKNGGNVSKNKDQRIRSRPATPSVFSESNWNSQTALLQRNSSRKSQNKVRGRNLLASLSCSGSCADEKSIYVQKNSEQRSSSIVDGKKKLQTRRNSAKMAEEEDQNPRKSLDVFGSRPMNVQEDTVAMNLERKLSVLTWDAIPNAQTVQKKATNREEDEKSDCSSDLFEIENLSGSGQPLFTSQTSDGLPSETETSPEFTTVTELEETKMADKGTE